jgi:hypothetical protein
MTAMLIARPLPAESADEVVVETLLTGLTNPCGVAVRPGESPSRYEIFVADSGAGRVVRLWSDEPESMTEAVTGFELAPLGETGYWFVRRADGTVVPRSQAPGRGSQRR